MSDCISPKTVLMRDSPLMLAAMKGDEVLALKLTRESSDEDFTAIDNRGQTALMYAASRGRAEIVRAYIERSDCAAQDHLGHTAFHLATMSGSEEAVKALLPKSDPNARTREGCTPLMLAASSAQTAIVDLLIGPSDLNARSSDGWTARDMAKGVGRDHIADRLEAAMLARAEKASLQECVATRQRARAPSRSL